MGRIKIKDLPDNVEISEEEMKKMTGGGLVSAPIVQAGGVMYAPTRSFCQVATYSIGEIFRGTCQQCSSCVCAACG